MDTTRCSHYQVLRQTIERANLVISRRWPDTNPRGSEGARRPQPQVRNVTMQLGITDLSPGAAPLELGGHLETLL